MLENELVETFFSVAGRAKNSSNTLEGVGAS
jgi:hypothetical protein